MISASETNTLTADCVFIPLATARGTNEILAFKLPLFLKVRMALDARAARLPANDPLVERLRTAAKQVDELHRKIVATKEGGAITGEERLRENLTELYGNISGYEGRPTQTQFDRADAIGREMGDVVNAFDAWLQENWPASTRRSRQKVSNRLRR